MSPTNISGAMLSVMKSIIAAASRTRTAADGAISASMRLMISEMPCKASSAKPTGRTSLTGQRSSPPAFDELSWIRQDSTNHGQVK